MVTQRIMLAVTSEPPVSGNSMLPEACMSVKAAAQVHKTGHNLDVTNDVG